MPSTQTQSSLWSALLAAQQAITAVAKDGKNEFHKYEYTTAEAMIGACRKALLDNGLVLMRRQVQVGDPFGPNGERMVTSTFVLHHPDSNDRFEDTMVWPAVPEKGRPIDKAVAVALTTALSYWLRDLLMVPRDDETINDRDDTQYAPPILAGPESLQMVRDLIAETDTDEQHLANYFHLSSLDQLPEAQVPKVVSMLQTKKQRQVEAAAEAEA